MKVNRIKLAPVLKWVGGKRQLLPVLRSRIPDFERYYEPFLGGGAVLFDLAPQSAVINDSNEELMNLYQMIKAHPEKLIESLLKHHVNEKYYYQLRNIDRNTEAFNTLSPIERASRIIYLNKTCFNGLFRTNTKGKFNAAWGHNTNANYINSKSICDISQYLNRNDIELLCGNFSQAITKATSEDFVYFDPPYDSTFIEYGKDKFTRTSQLELKKECDKLTVKGVKFLLSNSPTEFIINLYKDYEIDFINAKRVINSNVKGRGAVKEVLISNFGKII